jgi:hypothetical protein
MALPLSTPPDKGARSPVSSFDGEDFDAVCAASFVFEEDCRCAPASDFAFVGVDVGEGDAVGTGVGADATVEASFVAAFEEEGAVMGEEVG